MTSRLLKNSIFFLSGGIVGVPYARTLLWEAMDARRRSSKSDMGALEAVFRVLNIFRLIDPEMPVQQAQCLVAVGLLSEKSPNVKEVAIKAGIQQPSASRNLHALGATHWKKDENAQRREGHKLVAAVPDPRDWRSKRTELTPRGMVALRSLIQAVKGSR